MAGLYIEADDLRKFLVQATKTELTFHKNRKTLWTQYKTILQFEDWNMQNPISLNEVHHQAIKGALNSRNDAPEFDSKALSFETTLADLRLAIKENVSRAHQIEDHLNRIKDSVQRYQFLLKAAEIESEQLQKVNEIIAMDAKYQRQVEQGRAHQQPPVSHPKEETKEKEKPIPPIFEDPPIFDVDVEGKHEE